MQFTVSKTLRNCRQNVRPIVAKYYVTFNEILLLKTLNNFEKNVKQFVAKH